ncbi:negative elongation factor B [Aphelenchoides avenae]|nr:negative elongation factor B [Aphelenchus avenae]
MHNVRRAEYHEQVISELSERLRAKLKELGDKKTGDAIRKLEQQLERCFRLYRVPRIRPIVLETLRQLPKIADRYLKLIICDKEFYQACDVRVKQQIWLKNDALFLEALNPILDSYVKEKERVLLTTDRSPTNFFTCETTKSRRQWAHIKDLMAMVGDRESLYNRLVEMIRSRFLESGNPHYCSLRMEVIMAAHDGNVDYIVKTDPCHDFAWCLDACVRDKHLDAQQTSKLKVLLEHCKKLQNPALGDMAMVAGDPHVVYFLCQMAVKVIRDNAQSCGVLPREQAPLHLLLRLIALGASAKEIYGNNAPLAPVDLSYVTKFLPLITKMAAEDHIRLEMRSVQSDALDDYPDLKIATDATDEVVQFIEQDTVCGLLWLHYAMDLLPSKRRVHPRDTLLRYFRYLPTVKVAHSDLWLHLFVHRLITASTSDALLADEKFVTTVLLDFFVRRLEGHPTVRLHILRLCVGARSAVPEPVCRTLLNAIMPKPGADLTAFDEFVYAEYAKHVAQFGTWERRMSMPVLDFQAAIAAAAASSSTSVATAIPPQGSAPVGAVSAQSNPTDDTSSII